jgi:glutamine---fructose-6-phosphate transaminase (isomerizing)
MPEPRKAHPYHMYQAIFDQPALIESVLAQRVGIDRMADAVAEKKRITFVGIGTSLHAARVAESWLREFTGGRCWAHVEQSFELVHHPVAWTAEDAVFVITHTGTTSASMDALRVAQKAGAFTIAITGQVNNDEIRSAGFHIETCEQEIPFAYTKSYTTALTVLALAVVRIANQKNLLAGPSPLQALDRAPELVRQALALEPEVREWAKRVASLSRIEIFGSGAAWATASEAALKIKEASYIAAEGFETEEILHGPFSETDSKGSLLGLFTGDSADPRGRQIMRAAGELKMPRAAISVPSAKHDIAAEKIFLVPEIPAWLSAIVHLIPLQLLTYHLALERHVNPDGGRMEQREHAAAKKHYSY